MQSKLTLKNARHLRGYTLKEVAQKLRISVKTLSRYERRPGETPLHVAVILISLYQVPISLIDWR
ncbi:helix-turn-helix domain-containing protein [Brevibacillus borstelensis]|uniref:helix-turn-helix domain-containing protein n=1 Tax=Brevibacillus borstelensis TaxID=45462 RepID=UPI00399CE0BE